MAKATSKADMDPVFQDRVRELQENSKEEYEKRKSGQQVKWFRPGDWDGNLLSFQAIETPFKRDRANRDFVRAVENAKSPGTTGDLVATTTMIDYLAIMERAFRMRVTMRRPRAVAHMLARKRGHGNDKGVFVQNALEYVRSVLEAAKAKE